MKYSTKFDTDENPLSESGVWKQGAADGLDWTNVRTLSGAAFGTEDASAPDFKDSIACLQGLGTWGWHQRCRGTLKITNATTEPPTIEGELFIHLAIAANSATGYELTISNVTANKYIQINRWNGALGDFTTLQAGTQGSAGFGTVAADGDVWEFRDEGTSSVPLLKVYQNGILLTGLTYDTTPDVTKYTGGAPGVGFYDHATDLAPNNFQTYIQWSQFDATDDYFSGEVMQSDKVAPSTSATSTALAYPSSVTQGDLLVAAGYHAGTHAGSFTDTRGNSWVVKRTVTNASDGHTIDIAIATAKDTGACTVTYDHSGDAATQFRSLIVAEFKANFAIDKGAGTTGNSGTASSGASGTTANAFELLLGQIGSANIDGAGPTPTTNFVKIQDAIGGPSARWEETLLSRLTYAIGTFTNTATMTSSQQWSALVETLTLVATQTLLNYRFRNDDGSEATATWSAIEQTNVSVQNSVNFRLRLLVDTAGDQPSQPLTLQFRKFGDVSWTSVSASSKIQLAASPNIASGAVTPTTPQLTAPPGKTSASFTAGKISDDTNPLTGIDIALDFYSEYEFSLKTDGTPAVGETYEFQLTGTNMTTAVVPQVSIASTVVGRVVRFADLKADVTLRQPWSTITGAPMDVQVLQATPKATHDVTLSGRGGSAWMDVQQVAAASAALVGVSPVMTWSIEPSLALVAGSVALSGTSPAATWTASAIDLAIQPLALSGTSPLTTWTVPAIDVVAGSVALSGTAPAATWSVPTIQLAAGIVALSGASPTATWTASTLELAASPLALSGTSPSAVWSVAAIQLFQEGVLSGASPGITWTIAAIDLVQGPGGFQPVWALNSNRTVGFGTGVIDT